MAVQEQIGDYIASQPAPKADALRELHRLALGISPGCRLWFLDGRNEKGKIVSNPNIGYGTLAIRYANGNDREFYRIGLSANAAGISLYVMGLDDKTYLSRTYGGRIGKAAVTGYCVRFRSLSDVDIGVLEEVIRFGLGVE